MTTETNQKNNMKLPPHMRQWIVQQMVAINLQVLPAEIANKFLEFLKEREESGFAEELASCLSEAEKITERMGGEFHAYVLDAEAEKITEEKSEKSEPTCPKCYLIECCCEADKLEDSKNKELEIQMFHNAKPGSRTFRKIKECPCGQHAEEYGELDRFQEARPLLEKDVPFDEWGDERLDKWVRETYGDEADWALLSTMSQAEKDLAIELLPEFGVREQHGRNTETGIAVVFRDLDSDSD